MPFPLAELVLRGSGLVPDFRVFQFDAATNLSILTKYLQQITTSWKHRHFLETPTFLLTTRRMIFWSEPASCRRCRRRLTRTTGSPAPRHGAGAVVPGPDGVCRACYAHCSHGTGRGSPVVPQDTGRAGAHACRSMRAGVHQRTASQGRLAGADEIL